MIRRLPESAQLDTSPGAPRQLVPCAQPGHGLDLLKRKKGAYMDTQQVY